MGTPRIAFPEFRLPRIGSMTSLPVTKFPAPPMPARPLPRPRASVFLTAQARKYTRRTEWICRCIGQIYNNIPNIEQKSSAPPTKLPQILVGVDPMNLKSVGPPTHPEFRLFGAIFSAPPPTRKHTHPPHPPQANRICRVPHLPERLSRQYFTFFFQKPVLVGEVGGFRLGPLRPERILTADILLFQKSVLAGNNFF